MWSRRGVVAEKAGRPGFHLQHCIKLGLVIHTYNPMERGHLGFLTDNSSPFENSELLGGPEEGTIRNSVSSLVTYSILSQSGPYETPSQRSTTATVWGFE